MSIDDKKELAAEPFLIRPARRPDAPGLLRLITALAEFERLTPPDSAAQQRLIEDGFGPRPRFESWLAFTERRQEPVGLSAESGYVCDSDAGLRKRAAHDPAV